MSSPQEPRFLIAANSKQLITAAMHENVDISDISAIRTYWLAQGMVANFVDEFLPPFPASLGSNRWVYFDQWDKLIDKGS
jgi:hypothetical protein